MNFLTAAIPGLREIRAPLVAGYIWLIFVWLLVDPELPLTKHTDGALHSLVGLAAAAGSVATAAAVSVGAYLIGAISSGATDALGQRAARSPRLMDARLRSRKQTTEKDSLPMASADERLRTLESHVSSLYQRALEIPGTKYDMMNLAAAIYDVLPATPRTHELRESINKLLGSSFPGSAALLGSSVLEAVGRYRKELLLPATLLIGGSSLAFSETDRLKSEGQFRLAVSLPLTAIIVLLTVQGGASFWPLGLVAPVVLSYQGIAGLLDSTFMIRQTIEHGEASSPAMDDFAAYVAQELAAKEAQSQTEQSQPGMPEHEQSTPEQATTPPGNERLRSHDLDG